jgi:hypothetical protein
MVFSLRCCISSYFHCRNQVHLCLLDSIVVTLCLTEHRDSFLRVRCLFHFDWWFPKNVSFLFTVTKIMCLMYSVIFVWGKAGRAYCNVDSIQKVLFPCIAAVRKMYQLNLSVTQVPDQNTILPQMSSLKPCNPTSITRVVIRLCVSCFHNHWLYTTKHIYQSCPIGKMAPRGNTVFLLVCPLLPYAWECFWQWIDTVNYIKHLLLFLN